MSQYKHGTDGILGNSIITNATKAGTCAVYVGIAPVNLIQGYKEAGIINNPVQLNNISAKTVIGYSKNWSDFTLCEVLDAHFNSPLGNIGPIYVVNVLNPDVHRKAEQTTKSLTFTNGSVSIKSDTIILDTIVIADKVKGEDFKISYNFETGITKIESISKTEPLTGTVTISYYEIDLTLIDETEIIGKEEDGVYEGLHAISLLYQDKNVIPNLIAIPKWSEIKEVYEAVINYCEKINGHWYAYVYADIPILDGITKIDTITKAKDWASTNGYDKFKSKVFWPQYRYNNGNVYHASILAMAETLRTDLENNNIPMESCSNKILPKGSQYFGEDSTNRGFDEREGNLLNEVGITTIIKRGGQSYIWGPHTAGFESGDDGNAKDGIDQIAIFDTNIRMQYYILNNFQIFLP